MEDIGIEKFKLVPYQEVEVESREELEGIEKQVKQRFDVFRNGYNTPEKGMIGRIYKIINDMNNLIYVGATTQKLNKRWIGHMSNFNTGKAPNKPLHKAFREIGVSHFCIELIEEFYIDNQEELHQKEYEYQMILNTSEGNGYNQIKAPLFAEKDRKAYREFNLEERREKERNYEKEHKEKRKKKSIAYYHKNRDKIAKQRNDKRKGEKGDEIRARNRQYYQENKEHIQKRDKETREKRKDEHLSKQRARYQKDKDKISENNKAKRQGPEGDKMRAKQREWQRNNPEKRRQHRYRKIGREAYLQKRKEDYQKRKAKEAMDYQRRRAVEFIKFLFSEE